MRKNEGGAPVGASTDDITPVHDQDTLDLARVGKKQVLQRRFGLLSMTGFACALTITWEGMLTDFTLGLSNGGPAGLIYQYLLVWVGTLLVFITMGELSSMFPTAGGQYHWVNVLAPERSRQFLSYITGWVTTISWIAGSTAVAYFTGTLLQSVIALNNSSYEPKEWQGTLMMWAVILVSTAFTTVLGQVLPTVEILLLLLHILGFFGTIIPLAYFAGQNGDVEKRSREIFTTFFNLGGWKTQALSFFVGISGNATALLGLDGAIHMSEEVARSAVNVPRSIMFSIFINGTLGFAMLICVLFSVEDLETLAQSTTTYPIIGILAQSFNSVGGATAIVVLLIVMNLAASIGGLSSASRMMWSLARDRGLPGWQWLRKVDKSTSVPLNTVFTAATIAALLGLINIGSSTAFSDVISLVLAGFYLSYLLATSLLLYRRVRGDIAEPGMEVIFVQRDDGRTDRIAKPYTWGPWRLKGWLGTLCNILAVIYLVVVGFFALWPQVANVTAKNMDYASLVLGSVIIGSTVWYFLCGHRDYSGPVIEVQVLENHEILSSEGVH